MFARDRRRHDQVPGLLFDHPRQHELRQRRRQGAATDGERPRISLVGVVHVADPVYFEALQRERTRALIAEQQKLLASDVVQKLDAELLSIIPEWEQVYLEKSVVPFVAGLDGESWQAALNLTPVGE